MRAENHFMIIILLIASTLMIIKHFLHGFWEMLITILVAIIIARNVLKDKKGDDK